MREGKINDIFECEALAPRFVSKVSVLILALKVSVIMSLVVQTIAVHEFCPRPSSPSILILSKELEQE
jgi:hypothetical protein